MPFTTVAAELVPSGQFVLDGDVQTRAFSRVTTLKGASTALLSLAPALTLVGNLLTVPAPARPWSMATFAGIGLTLNTSVAAGNFPEVAIRDVQVKNTASISQTYTYPIARQVGQLLVVAVATAALTTISTPAFWTLVQSQAGTESRTSIFSKVLDGTEPSTEVLSFGTSSGAVVRTWCINLADTGVEATAGVNNSVATTLDLAAVTPTWAVTEATSTLYIAVLGLADDVTVSAFPTGYTVTGQDKSVSGTANVDCALAYAERSSLGSTEDPSAFTYGASRSTGHILAIKPKVSGRIDWDGVTVRKNSGANVGTRRRMNLIEGSGVTMTVADDGANDEVDVTINATGGGGADWATVLAVGHVSGANNAHIDTGQILSLGVEGSLPPTGQIRSSTDLAIRCVGAMDLIATTAIQLQALGTTSIRLFTNAVERLEIQGDGAWQLAGVTGTAGQYIRSTGSTSPPAWASLALAELPSQAADTFLGRLAGAGTPLAQTLASLASTSLVYDATSHTFQSAAASGGDITRTQNSNTYTIATGAVTFAKLQTIGYGVLGNPTVATTVAPSLIAPPGGFTVLQDNNAGVIVFALLSTGSYNNNSVTYAKMQDVTATSRFIGRITAGAGDPEELTGTQATTLLDVFSSTLKGLTPLSGGGTTNFLRADGAWAAPPTTLAGHVIKVNNAAATQRGNVNFLNTTTITATGTDDAVNNETEMTFTVNAFAGGDVTSAANSLVLTIGTNAVSNAKAAQMPALSVKANATNATANAADINATADDTVFRRTSTTLNWGQLTVGMAPNSVWTYAKIQNVTATSRILGRITAGAGVIEELTGTQATTLLDVFSSTLKGLAPLSGGGTANFLRADGTWTVPPAGSPISTQVDDTSTGAQNNVAKTADIIVFSGAAPVVSGIDATGMPIGQLMVTHYEGAGFQDYLRDSALSTQFNRLRINGKHDIRVVDDEACLWVYGGVVAGTLPISQRWINLTHRYPFCNTPTAAVGDQLQHDGTDWVNQAFIDFGAKPTLALGDIRKTGTLVLVSGGSIIGTAAGFNFDTANTSFDVNGNGCLVTGTSPFLQFTEASSNTLSNVAGRGAVWVEDTAPNRLIFKDDVNNNLPINVHCVAQLTSTVTLTTTTVTDILSYTRIANADRVNTSYRLKATVQYVKTAVSTTSPTFTLAAGGVSLVNVTLTQNATAATAYLTVEAIVTIRTVGAAGAAVHASTIIAVGGFGTLAANTTPQGNQATAATVISTTVSQTISLRGNLATAVGGNALTILAATIERMN